MVSYLLTVIDQERGKKEFRYPKEQYKGYL